MHNIEIEIVAITRKDRLKPPLLKSRHHAFLFFHYPYLTDLATTRLMFSLL